LSPLKPYLGKSTAQGPLPPPSLYAGYEEVIPGSAERILKLTEREQSHRQELEMKTSDIQKANVRRGHWMGFALGFCGIVAAVVCAIYDRPIIAGLSAISVIVGVATAFFRDRNADS